MSRFAFLAAGVVWLSAIAMLRAEAPLYDEEPYDQVTLDAASNNKVVKICPLKDRTPPPRGRPADKLKVRPFDEPNSEYEIAWRSIVKLELFEQLVLNKANDLVDDGQFEDAFDYFTWLDRNKADTPGLSKAVDKALYEEAKACHRKQQFDGALALLRELHSRSPRRPGLDIALGRTTDELVKRYVSEENYESARELLHSLTADFPEHPVAVQWRERMTKRASPIFAEAKAAVDAGQWAKAGELMRQVAVIWPELPGARDMAMTVHKNYPRVVIGVTNIAGDAMPNRFDDWATQRTSRLLYRRLTEFAGASSEGGKYDCPVGTITLKALNRRLAIRLKPNVDWAVGNATLSNADVSRRLMAMTDPTDPTYRVDWADLMQAVSMQGIYDLEVELRRPHVRPEAMLQMLLTPHGSAPKPGIAPPVNGPFVVSLRSPEVTIYAANAQYFAAKEGQPKEVVERGYPSISKAIQALRRGEIQVIDRVNPWNLAALRANPYYVVQPYGLPLVHCLIPNIHRPLVSDRNFRRALVYGIARDKILEQMLGGTSIPGCAVTGSPFPMGIDPGDAMGYATDDSITPRPYERPLAKALAMVALTAYAKSQNNPKMKMPTLILAHPRDEIATASCASIQMQLKLLDIPVKLRPIDGPMPSKVPDDVDLLYAELPIWEPLVDARRVLGEDGMSGGCSPYMTLVLRQLDEAVDWSQVRDCLHRVHRIAYDDTAVVPLWQLVEHFVYRSNVHGVGAKPVSLYQNIEQWRPPFLYPAEK